MPKLSLANPVKDYSNVKSEPIAPGGKDDDVPMKDSFPQFTIQGPAAKKLMKRLSRGDKLDATVRLHVVGIQDREDGKGWPEGCSIEVEVLEMDSGAKYAEVDDDDEDSDDEESAGDAIDKYRAGKE